MRNLKHKKQKGFTLIELMTALSIFIVVLTLSMGSILSVFDANRKSRSLKTVMDNLNFSLESMSREMRFGKNYHCDDAGTLTTPQNCPGGDNFVTFLSSDNQQISYKQTGTTIEKSVANGTFIPVTAPEITITDMKFYTLGAVVGDSQQPRIFIKITGFAGDKVGTRSSFSVQTLVSQRQIDR